MRQETDHIFFKAELNYYSSFELNETADKSLTSFGSNSDDDSTFLELKLKSLLLDIIYYINVVEELIETNVTNVNDWNWQKQLRHILLLNVFLHINVSSFLSTGFIVIPKEKLQLKW